MSDDEFDPEWKPSGRPQSTLARSFSAALHDAFMIDTSIDTMSAAVEEKKRAVTTRNMELEALEARLRETEERLKKSRATSPHSGQNSPHQRTPLGSTFAAAQDTTPSKSRAREQPNSRPAPGPKEPSYAAPPVPGGLPPTPGEEGSDTTATASGDPSSTSEGSQ
ncbi:MAG: hypothetical protein M1819_002071 [Sarea resinae]|nr:MAG: hypothetical protein M1819_002071 [Sarea resinae]